jgi:acyl-CoA synthetase (NDP forming)
VTRLAGLVATLAARARSEGRDVLLEHEGYDLLDAAGVPTPRRIVVGSSAEAARADLGRLGGDRVVVKVLSPAIPHKSDVGGVAVAANRPEAVADAVRAMETRLGGHPIAGFLLCEFVRYDAEIGGELLVGLRWTDEFGPVLTVGPGGVYAEFLAGSFKAGSGVALLSPSLDAARRADALGRAGAVRLALDGWRGQPGRVTPDGLARALAPFLALGEAAMPEGLAECEVNPLALTARGPVALDVLVKLGGPAPAAAAPRPLAKMKRLLEPRSAAIIGVSEQLNPGHIILNNLIREGFDRSRIYVVKPNAAEIEGCRCVPDVASLPERVDLLVLAVSAAQVPRIITDVVSLEKAESLIVIPGGLEEKAGTEAIVRDMHAALARSRATAWQGPLINGGNCLGIQSRPGRYDTMFIPEYKLPAAGRTARVAVVSQSGAFAVARASKLAGIRPKYTITAGNQMDLTVGEYLEHLEDDEEIDVYAVYVEGFKPLDGRRFLEASARIAARGAAVVLYRAGRTAAGAKATASHTASIAGDYTVTRGLAEAAGVVVAGTLEEFEDLVRLFAWMGRTPLDGRRLAAVSNAGFECVAIADNLGGLELARFAPATVARLGEVFTRARIASVVDVHNPLDLTPMTADAAYEAVVRAIMDDPGVDLGVVGCVPLTGALQTLPAGPGHREDLTRDDSVVRRLVGLRDAIAKPWVAVVDSGALYDPMAQALDEAGIPTFRSADRALRALDRFADARLRGAGVRETALAGA